MDARHVNYNGMNWVRQEKRLAIYLRDGMACVYCGDTVEGGAKLTLDHILPVSLGGRNDSSNLVTACHRCNSSRGNRSVEVFAVAVAAYQDTTAEKITDFISETILRTLDIRMAKEIIAKRREA